MKGPGLLSWLLALLVLAGAGFAWFRAEGSAPSISAPESILLGATGRSVTLELADAGSGLRSFDVVLSLPGGERMLASERFAGSLLAGATSGAPRSVELSLVPEGVSGAGAEGFLRVSARDWSLRGGLKGNETLLEIPVRVDLQAPRVRVETGLTYARRGGTGAVAYTVSEETARDGVQVGDAFFRGFPMSGRRVALYAIPTDAPENPTPVVVAEDRAGNVAEARWPVVVMERKLPSAEVRLPENFLESRVPELAEAEGIAVDDLAEAFHRVNTEVRAANERHIRELAAESTPERLWSGPFVQLENSKVTSRFAERRTYYTNGHGVSNATHFGYDLAATRAAPVTASNAGRVLFAGPLGIYGNCVLLDHGLGVTSLYGHLSRVDVAAGDAVEKGQALGLSGATGLAGGDHLHFAILVGETYVDPLEWWDPKWVQANVEARLPASIP